VSVPCGGGGTGLELQILASALSFSKHSDDRHTATDPCAVADERAGDRAHSLRGRFGDRRDLQMVPGILELAGIARAGKHGQGRTRLEERAVAGSSQVFRTRTLGWGYVQEFSRSC
jgi:hypothetical protein